MEKSSQQMTTQARERKMRCEKDKGTLTTENGWQEKRPAEEKSQLLSLVLMLPCSKCQRSRIPQKYKSHVYGLQIVSGGTSRNSSQLSPATYCRNEKMFPPSEHDSFVFSTINVQFGLIYAKISEKPPLFANLH